MAGFFYLVIIHTSMNCILVNTRRCLDVVSTFFERYGRQMDVETTSCAIYNDPYWFKDFIVVVFLLAYDSARNYTGNL